MAASAGRLTAAASPCGRRCGERRPRQRVTRPRSVPARIGSARTDRSRRRFPCRDRCMRASQGNDFLQHRPEARPVDGHLLDHPQLSAEKFKAEESISAPLEFGPKRARKAHFRQRPTGWEPCRREDRVRLSRMLPLFHVDARGSATPGSIRAGSAARACSSDGAMRNHTTYSAGRNTSVRRVAITSPPITA